MPQFQVVSPYQMAGDQPEAVDKLATGFLNGVDEQVLLGVTGSGKTFTMANIIERVQKPTLVLAHNKTLAAQLCSELREFFPNQHVEVVLECAAAGLGTGPAGNTSGNGSGTQRDDFGFDALGFERVGDLAQRGVGAALLVRAAVDEQYFHGSLPS